MSKLFNVHLESGGKMRIEEWSEKESMAETVAAQTRWLKSQGMKREDAPEIPEECKELRGFKPIDTDTEIIHLNRELAETIREKIPYPF